MSRPLVIFTLIFSLGIVVGATINISFLCLYFPALALLVFSFFFRRKEALFNIFLFLLVFCLGALFLKNSQTLPRSHISKFVHYKIDSLYLVRGAVESRPKIESNRTTFILRAREARINGRGYGCRGKVLIRISGQGNFEYGEELCLKGKLYRPGKTQVGWRDYLKRQGIYVIMRVQSRNALIRISRRDNRNNASLILQLKERAEKIIYRHLSGLPAAITEAMLLGEKRHIPTPVYNSMVNAGTVHILVVSGFNVGIVAFMVILALKLIRLRRQARIFAALIFLVTYCLLTGASNPVVRATVMAAIFICAYLFRREPDIYNSCAASALFILLVNPQELFDIGFQLSFASVISIIFIYPKIRALFKERLLKNRYLRFIVDSCLVSLSAWMGTAGLIAYYFKLFSPIAVFANLFIIPLATFITLCGFSLIFASLINPGLGQLFSLPLELAALLLVKINAFLVSLPGAFVRF